MNPADLRQKAEDLARERAARTPEDSAPLSLEQMQKTIHELLVHQIELEIQNAQLRTAQTQIEAGRARYYELYDLASVGYCTLSEHGLILEANLTTATQLGTTRSALVKQPISRFILKDDQSIYSLHQKQLFETGEVQQYDLRLLKADGAFFWAHLTATAAQEDDGAPLCRVVISDITERKLAEEALRENEALLSRSQEIAHTGSWKLDLTENHLTWSDETYRIFGCKLQEFAPTYKAFLNFVHPEDRLAVDEAYSRSVRDGNDGYEIEHRIVRRNSAEVRHVHERCVHERDTVGTVIQSTGIVQDITERKQAEEELRHTHELMHYIVEHTNSGVAIHDRNLNYLYVSQRYLDMYNVKEQEVLGKHHYEVFPDLPQKWREVHQKALAGEVSSSDRDPYVREDGTVEYTRWECRPWHEADGSVGGIIVYTEVITDQLQQEQSLREYVEKLCESEENLRITLRSIGDAVISTDVDGRVVSMNPVAESLTGWSEKEAAGEPLDEVFRIINEQTRQTVESPVTNVLKTGQIVGLANHTLLIAKDGKETPIADSGAPICNARGETTGVVLVFRDQTQERDSRLVLEESEARLRRAQKVAQVGEWEFNLKTGIFNASDSARRIYGLTDGDLSIEAVQKIPLPQYRPLLDAAMNDLIHEGKPYDVEFTIVRACDQTLVEIYSAAEYDPQTETVFGVIQDITERKQVEAERKSLQAQLLQSQKMESVGRLAGGVAHDFNNMLGVIIGHAEIQLRRMGKENPVRGSMESIQNAAKRSADLTGQLLAFARKQTIAPKILDLNETVEGMLKMLRRLIGEDIGLVWNPSGNTHPVFMDPSQLDQILVNLCVNARDAIKDVGKITIETEYVDLDDAYCTVHTDAIPGKYTLLAVSDDGCGMDEETRLKIFDPFFTTKDLGKGTGLGLSTVYGIVRQNLGFINVYSEPGRGTTFRIYIPIHQGESEAEVEVAALETTRGNGETILLVEDEPALLDMTCSILEELGYRVIPVGGPLPALAEVAKEDCRPDLVITDVVMPVMNGKEMAEKILQNCPEMKVLFMSGYTSNTIVHHGVLDKGVSFIQKPFSVHDLGVKVREALVNCSGSSMSD